MTPCNEARALSGAVDALLGNGVTRADRAFLVDGRLYKLTIEQIKDEIAMQKLFNREAGLPSHPDDPYATDPADMRDALTAAMADPNLSASLADRLSLFLEIGSVDSGVTKDAMDALRDVVRWHRERKEVL